MRIASVTLLLSFMPALTWAQMPAVAPAPIIDMHVHAAAGYGVEPEDDAARERALDRVAELNIVMAAYFAKIPEILDRAAQQPRVDVLPYLGMLCPPARLPCYPQGDSLPDLEWLRDQVITGRFAGLGEINVQYYGMRPTDPRVQPYFALAEELGIPIGYHMGLGPPGEAYRRPYRLSLGNPLLLEDLLIRYPDLRLYVQHAGLPYLQEMIGIMIMYPQVYVDLSAISSEDVVPRETFYAFLKSLVDAGLGKRLMYGSDGWVAESIDAISSAPFLSEDQKRDIFYNNAARFLRLTEEQMSEHHRRVRRPGTSQ